jgi:anthranilate phosphoribosyltransferase
MGLRRVRGEIGVRTPLSTIEKLLAPARATLVVGAQGGPVLGQAVGVVQAIGHPRGIVLQGPEGGVVPSVKRRTRGIEFSPTQQVPLSIEPRDFGICHAEEPDLPMFGPPEEGYGCGDNPLLVKAAAQVTESVLAGASGPARDAAALGAAVILRAAGRAPTMADGLGLAYEAIDSGAARRILAKLRAMN